MKSTVSSNDVQIGGNHYRFDHIKIQPWDYIAANNLDFFQGNIIKYITRWRDKGGVEDLLKARHMLNKYIEVNQCESKKTEV